MSLFTLGQFEALYYFGGRSSPTSHAVVDCSCIGSTRSRSQHRSARALYRQLASQATIKAPQIVRYGRYGPKSSFLIDGGGAHVGVSLNAERIGLRMRPATQDIEAGVGQAERGRALTRKMASTGGKVMRSLVMIFLIAQLHVSGAMADDIRDGIEALDRKDFKRVSPTHPAPCKIR